MSCDDVHDARFAAMAGSGQDVKTPFLSPEPRCDAPLPPSASTSTSISATCDYCMDVRTMQYEWVRREMKA